MSTTPLGIPLIAGTDLVSNGPTQIDAGFTAVDTLLSAPPTQPQIIGSASESIANTTYTIASMSALSLSENVGSWSPSSTTVTVPTAGTYLVEIGAAFPTAVAWPITLAVMHNGGDVPGFQAEVTANGVGAGAIVRCSAADTLGLHVSQGSGGTVSMSLSFSAVRICS